MNLEGLQKPQVRDNESLHFGAVQGGRKQRQTTVARHLADVTTDWMWEGEVIHFLKIFFLY